MDPADSKQQFGEKPLLHTNSRSSMAQSDAKAAPSAPDPIQAVFHGSGIQHSGQGDFNVQGNVNIMSNAPSDSKEEIEECMKALFLTDPSEDRDVLKRKKGKRASGTCEWIFNTKKLNDWLHLEGREQASQPSNILWLHGNPGKGKSTMAIFLTEKLSTDFDTTKNMTLAYFFCDASFEKQKTATSIIRGLLYLLVQKHRNLISKYILPTYKERGDQLFTSFDALWRILLAAAADEDTGQKYCIIDALDECDNDSKDILLSQLHETFHCQEKPPPNLSILITSRPYPVIREYLQDFTNADLSSFYEARQDIERCIGERVDDLAKKKNYSDKLKREVTDLLRDKAEGTFLWVGLACEELRGKPSKNAIQFLQDMPKGLISLYANLLKTATEDETSECVAIRRILSFVVVSFEALSVEALSEACQLHQDEPDMDTRLQYTRDQIASCRLLVVVSDEKVQLLHQSVRDFLTGSGSGFFVERFEAHASAASCCINDLIKRLHSKNSSEGPLLGYASKYWTEHVREAGESFKICEAQIPFFKTNSNSLGRWIRKYDRYLPTVTFLHIAAHLGLPILVEYALGIREVHPIVRGSSFNIRKGVNSLDESGCSPLYAAVCSRNTHKKTITEIVNMLLRAGAIVTQKVIEAAIYEGRDNKEVLLTLLDQMDPEARIKCIQHLLEKQDSRDCNQERLRTRRQYTSGVRWRKSIHYDLSVTLILSNYGDQVKGEERVVNAAVSSSAPMLFLESLLDQRGGRIAITELAMTNAAKNEEQGSKIVEYLLKHQRDSIPITENVIIAAIHNKRHNKKIIQLLYQYQGDKITITTNILEAVAVQEKDGELVEILLRCQGGQNLVTEEVILAAMKNERQGGKIIQLLCRYQRGKIIITARILEAALIQLRGRECIELLIQHRGDQPTVAITDCMLDFGVSNYDQARETFAFILQNLGDRIYIADDTMIAVLRLSYRGPELIEFLIQEGGAQIVISDEIVQAGLHSEVLENQTAYMDLFFKHQQKLKFSGQALATILEYKKNPVSGEWCSSSVQNIE
ncbi:hypothetical protein GGI42DRAFT_337068 [Trichoderma sp. SZMC 28013]